MVESMDDECIDCCCMDGWMYQWINGCMADLVVRWMNRLMPIGWMAGWIVSFVDGWMIRCLDG